jgi:hypothetical protein
MSGGSGRAYLYITESRLELRVEWSLGVGLDRQLR